MHEKLVHFRFEIFLISQLAILFGELIIPHDLFDSIFSPLFFYLNLLAGGIILISKKRYHVWLVFFMLLVLVLLKNSKDRLSVFFKWESPLYFIY